MRLFIAEKPSLGKAIARGLGGGHTENGHIRCGDDCVTWCFGHLLEPAWPEAYAPEYAQWRREHLPIIPSSWKYVVKQKAAAQLKLIGKLLRDADAVVNAGDPDREGQLLVDEVLEHFAYRGPVFRIWLPSLDDKSVRIALNDIRDNAPNAPLRDAARARMLADWLVGMNATRALTISGRESGRAEVLSLGRVQTPTLALVVGRDREIASFTPSNYFMLRVGLAHASGNFSAVFVPTETQGGLDDAGRLVDISQAASIIEQVNGAQGTILESLREKKSTPAPLPHSLSSLQKAASSRFGMSAKRVLDTAQSLYEKKLTTYPRTDCRYLPEEQFEAAAGVLKALAAIPGLEQCAGKADGKRKSAVWNTRKVTAHHAIVPTGECPEQLSGDERSLFLLIATSFCLQFHPPMRHESQKIVVALGDTRWEATGRRLLEAGWTAFAREQEDEDAQEQPLLPLVEQGDGVRCDTAESVRKKTAPPSRFTEGSLIEAMANVHRFVDDAGAKGILRENEGIGTEATRAGILETLKRRKYLVNQGKALVSTRLAGQVIDAVPQALKDPVTTAHWESRLKAIAEGTDSLDAFMADQTTILPTLLAPLLSGEIVIKVDGPVFPCPVCGKPLQKSANERGPFWRCLRADLHPEGKPVHLPDDRGRPGERRAPALTEFACETCGKPLRHVTGEKNGRRYDFFACSDKECGATFDNVDGKPVPRKAAQDSGFVCPDCGKPLRRQSRVSRRTGKAFTVYNCSGYPRCKASFFENNGKPDFGN